MQYDPPPPPSAPSPPAPRETAPRGGRRRARTLVKWIAPAVAAVAVGAIGGIGVAAAIHMPRVDSLADFRPSLVTRLHDRTGATFATYARQNRELIEEGEVPKVLENALIASEDRNFFEHGGIDLMAIFRAQLANLRAGRTVEGASTLTMQLARELFLSRAKTWRRKIEEAFLAVELEKTYSKQQILTLYLNLVNVGGGYYGMKAAAQGYFGKPVEELTAPEAAMLVGILPSPTRYNPYRHPQLVLERRDSVLRRMREAGFLGRQEYEEAVAQPLGVVTRAPRAEHAAYFAEDVRKYLEATYGTSALVEGGLDVQTTLDPTIEAAAEKALRDGLVRLDHRKGWRGPVGHVDDADPKSVELPSWSRAAPTTDRWYRGIVLTAGRSGADVKIHDQVYHLDREGMSWTGRSRPDQLLKRGDVAWFRLRPPSGDAADAEPTLQLEQEPELEGAVLVLESATGAVRAMVGGFDFEHSQFNRVTQAHRQVGSAFKPFVYGAALRLGYTPADTLFDGPTRFPGADNELSYQPRNYHRDYYGILTLRRALELSINVTSVKLMDLIGAARAIDFAHACGIHSDLPPYPSLALGTAELVPLELAAAYATIANQGTYVEPHLVEKVTSPDGRTLEEHIPNTRTAISPPIAYVLTHMMEGVVDRGTAADIRDLDIDIAGKTGTTDDYTDAWFVGFTPRYTLLSWVGYNVKRSIGRGMTGAAAALPIWRQLAESGLEEGWLQKGSRFPVPPGVVVEPVEYYTGLLPGPGANRVIDEAFVEGTEPARTYTPHWAEVMDLPWYQQLAFYIPKEGERMPVVWESDGAEIDVAEAAGRPAEGVDTEAHP